MTTPEGNHRSVAARSLNPAEVRRAQLAAWIPEAFTEETARGAAQEGLR